jgi:hypothetical protein
MVTSSRQVLQKRIQSFIGLQRHSGKSELDWFRRGKRISLNNGRAVLSFLSDICDEVYPLAPKFRNELVNRHQLSSAAAAARMRLIARAFKHSSEPLLGMDPKRKPPEMSIYLSLLLNTGLHQRKQNGWALETPNRRQDVCNVLPALNSLDTFLRSKEDERVKITAVFENLRQPPLGIRDGIAPILLALYSIINEQHVAFYDKGAFMTEMSELDYMRLTKWPGNFEIQLCRFVGVRADLFDKLLIALRLRPAKSKGELLDIVRPLCSFVAQLPPYTQKTSNLTSSGQAVRLALMKAREPGPLLFNELPVACGLREFPANSRRRQKEIRGFVTALKGAVDQLREAYPQLQERLKTKLLRSFQIELAFAEARKVLFDRAEAIMTSITEARLKAFCFRLLDQTLADNDWIVALSSVVVELPPSKWKDEHEEQFAQEIENLVSRFERVERLTFARRGSSATGFAMRVAVTNVNGTERDKVIFTQKGEEERIRRVQRKLESVLLKNGNVELAALATVFWNALGTNPTKD